jgi:hypothetical protein
MPSPDAYPTTALCIDFSQQTADARFPLPQLPVKPKMMWENLGGFPMRSRCTIYSSRDELARLFGLDTADVPDQLPRYNIVPTQLVAVI